MRALQWVKVHRAALGAFAITLAGILSEPKVLGLLPENVAHVVAAIGAVLQAIARQIPVTPEKAPDA